MFQTFVVFGLNPSDWGFFFVVNSIIFILMKKCLLLYFLWTLLIPVRAENHANGLWKIIQADTFPQQYQYGQFKHMANQLLEALNRNLKPNTQEYNDNIRSVILYQSLAGNTQTADSLLQVISQYHYPNPNELTATKLLAEWLPCFQDQNTNSCPTKAKAIRDFLANNFITDEVNEAMKWHWIAKMMSDSVLIDHKNKIFSYTPILDDNLNPKAYRGAVLATHRLSNSTNILISNGYHDPIKLLEMDSKGKWKDVTKIAGLSQIPGGERMYAVDINNDGREDILILRNISSVSKSYLYPSLLLNQANGTYQDISQKAGLNIPQRSRTACFLDANDDGKLDIFLGNESYPSLLFIQGENNTFKESAKSYGIITSPSRVVDCFATDINHDGHDDLLLSLYNQSNKSYVFQKIDNQYPFFIDKALENEFYKPYKGGKFLVGDYDGNQTINIISTADHSTHDKDVVFNILSGSSGPDEYSTMWDLDTFDIKHTIDQYSQLNYLNTALNIDLGDASPYILFGGGKQWDEIYPITLYKFLTNRFYFQMNLLDNQPNYVNSMTITPKFKPNQPIIWLKGGLPIPALKNRISTYLQNSGEGRYIQIKLIGKARKDALGSKITVTSIDANGNKMKRTRLIQAVDSDGKGAGQDIWFLPDKNLISKIEILWHDGSKQILQNIRLKKRNLSLTISQE